MLQTSLASTVYLDYDPACMDRYEYRYKGVNSGFSHIVYHLRLNDKEKIVLEVGIESKIDYETKPNNVKRCSEISINERLVREINNGDLQLYIVKKSGTGFNVSPVGISTYSQISDRGIGFSSMDNIFAYDYSQPANGANLARKGSTAKIFYNGTLSHTCPKKFLFTKTKNQAGKNYTEMTIVPGVGVTQEKTGFNQTDAENNVLELVSINGIALNNYLNAYCRTNPNGLPSTFYSSRKGSVEDPLFNNTITGNPIVTNPSTGTNNPTITETPTTTPGIQGTGQPNKFGECTVYKDLDRNLYVDRATGRPANGECGGNNYQNGYMLSSGSVVNTNPSNTGPTNVIETTPGTNVVDVTPGPSNSYVYCKEVSTYGTHIVQPNETLYSIARQYGVTVNEIKKYNGLNQNVISPCQKLLTRPASEVLSQRNDILVAKDGSDYVHVVQKGETLYKLASRYGYTVEKFKAINGLTSNVLSIGQRLRISDCNCPSPSSSPETTTADASGELPNSFEAKEGRILVDGPQKRRLHIVKEEETIYSIAREYNVSVDRLRALNNLEANEIIIPFQRLYVN
jgi:LysM repeat protein